MSLIDVVIIALLVGGFMLISRWLKRAAERVRRQQALAGAQPPAPVQEDVPVDAMWGPGPQAQTWQGATSAELARRVEPTAPGTGPMQPRMPSNALFRTRQDLRRAVVAMTVLGPCRALDPPGRN
jgi:hypothetical protein